MNTHDARQIRWLIPKANAIGPPKWLGKWVLILSHQSHFPKDPARGKDSVRSERLVASGAGALSDFGTWACPCTQALVTGALSRPQVVPNLSIPAGFLDFFRMKEIFLVTAGGAREPAMAMTRVQKLLFAILCCVVCALVPDFFFYYTVRILPHAWSRTRPHAPVREASWPTCGGLTAQNCIQDPTRWGLDCQKLPDRFAPSLSDQGPSTSLPCLISLSLGAGDVEVVSLNPNP